MKRIVLTFGLIAGAVLSIMMFLTIPFMEKIGSERAMVIGYTTMVLAFLMVYFGVRSYRDTVLGGTIGFWRAAGVGLLIALIGSVCYVASWEIIYHFFMPDFVDKYAAHALDQLRARGATAEQLARKAQEMEQFRQAYRNPLLVIAYTFLEPLPVALVMSLVSAGILRRRAPARDDAAAATFASRSPAL